MSRVAPAGRRPGQSKPTRSAMWIPFVVVGLLAMPLMLTSRSFGHDWTLHLWAVRQQQLNIEALGHPGLFVSVRPLGVFYPLFAFVGSGLYTVGGYLAIVLGNRPILAYKLLYLLGFAFAYGGMTWLSVQLGLRSWRSQMPGLVLVTGAYFITDLAARGDLGEFMGLATIPFLVAAARAVLTAERRRGRDIIAVVVAVFFISGSHNITLLWGAIFVGFLVLVSAAALVPDGLPPIPWARVGTIAGAGAVGVGLNAWFLVPDLRYGLDTHVAGQNANKVPKTVLAQPGLLLNPLRVADGGNSAFSRDIRLTLPWLFALWALVVVVMLWRRRAASGRRGLVGMFAVAVVYIALITWHGLWKHLPHLLYNVQFTWRLNAYVLLATAVVVLLALRWQATAPEPFRRASTTVLVVFVLFNLGAATWQVWRVRSEYVRRGHEVVTGSSFGDEVVASRYDQPLSWYAKGDFRDTTPPPFDPPETRMLTVPVEAVRKARFAGVLAVPDGREPFRTNISAGPRFVTMTGIRPVGRTHDGSVVAVRAPGVPATGPIEVTITAVDSRILRAGAIVSLASAAAFLALIAAVFAAFVRERVLPAFRPAESLP